MRQRTIAMLTTVSALVLAPVLAPAAHAPVLAPVLAPEVEQPGPTVRLVVDTSMLLEDERENVARWIGEEGVTTLAEAGVRVDNDSAELEVRVTAMPEGLGYAVQTSVWRAGADTAQLYAERKICEACNRPELLKLVDRELMWLGGWLATPVEIDVGAEPDAAKSPADVADVAEVADAANRQPEVVQAESKAAESNVLRNAGMGLVIGGGVALGVGIGLAGAGLKSVDDGSDFDITEKNYGPTGIGVATVGGAATLAGVALLVLHVRRSPRRETVSVSPTLSPARPGVVLTGRF
jgi:hypothetical protein